jgi:hypothetical protein
LIPSILRLVPAAGLPAGCQDPRTTPPGPGAGQDNRQDARELRLGLAEVQLRRDAAPETIPGELHVLAARLDRAPCDLEPQVRVAQLEVGLGRVRHQRQDRPALGDRLGMLPLTRLVFSRAFVMVRFGATAYSPRPVTWFAGSAVMSHSLGIFTATFIYSLAALAWVDRGGT